MGKDKICYSTDKRTADKGESLPKNDSYEIISCSGDVMNCEVGKLYSFYVPAYKKLGEKYVSYLTRDFGKTRDGKEVKLKIVYRRKPVKIPSLLSIKINRILEKDNKILVKAYPQNDIY
ncbi:MAG: hypothetical protein KAU20_04480 [Nanoarchaeota archaeon]|nr:hypothetical protein [Nanoarchaeota archaeon]